MGTFERVRLAIETSRHAPELRNYPLFAEPIGEGTSKGNLVSSKIGRPDDLNPAIDQLEAVYGGQDILLKTFLSGREMTVGIVGTGETSKIIGANEYVYKDRKTFGSRRMNDCVHFASDDVENAPMDGKESYGRGLSELVRSTVHNACQLALETWKVHRCRDAGRIDTRFDIVGETGKTTHFGGSFNAFGGTGPLKSILVLISSSG